MTLSQMPCLVMFDLDGTLADTVPQLHEAVLRALEKVGRPPVTIDQTRSYVGNGAMMLLARAIRGEQEVCLADIEPQLLHVAREEFNSAYLKCSDCSKSIYSHVVDTLSFLQHKGVKLAVVSNKPDKFIKPILEKADLLKFFSFTLGSEVIAEKKPSAEPLLYVCNKLGVTPDKAVMVGDSYNDVQAAHNAKVVSMALTYGYNRGLDIRDSSPDYVFDNFGEIYQVFKSLDV